jgi:hypothetical protein
MNFFNAKTRKTITIVIVGVLVLAMLAALVASLV